MDYFKKSLQVHKKLRGKISTKVKDNLYSLEKLSLYYTPGVAEVSRFVANNPQLTGDYTWVNNNVAVVSDGSAVLGLGDIGPEGALPVMEGKAMIFKSFAGIDAVPIVINVHTADEIVKVIKAIAPSFGGINLEDIAAPVCFEVEERLKNELSIPVMHDDQHGTAVVVLAGLINSLKITKRKLSKCRVVIVGAGAAGTAVAKLLYKYGHPEILIVDSQGIISGNRVGLNSEKIKLLDSTNPQNISGTLEDALKNADIFIGVSKPNLLTAKMIQKMKKDPIIFAMANPMPEILPSEAKKAGAAIIATGRSDFPNQVNNALAFPGIFRGALDNKVTQITDKHKIAAAVAIAKLVKSPSPSKIIPGLLDAGLVKAVAAVIK
jgi:malate dehydrogenase (oxaloacetate-decarboxylating)